MLPVVRITLHANSSAVTVPYVVEMPPSGGCITAEMRTGGGGMRDWAAFAQWGNPGLDLEIKAP